MAVITDIWIRQATATQQNLAGLKLALQFTCQGADKPKVLVFPAPSGQVSIYHANASNLSIDDQAIESMEIMITSNHASVSLPEFNWLPASIWVSSLSQHGQYRVLSGDPNWQPANAFNQQQLAHPLTLVPATAPLSTMTLQFGGMNATVFGQGDSGLSLDVGQPFTVEFSLQDAVASHGSLAILQLNSRSKSGCEISLEATGPI
jgi:hypothetical protein